MRPRGPAEVADSAAYFTAQVHARSCRFTLDLRPSHLEVHAQAGLSLRTMAAGDEPLELATRRRMVERKPSRQQQSRPPTARGAQGPRRPRPRPRARVWRPSGLQRRPTAAWAARSAAFAPCPSCRPRHRLHRPLRSEAAVRVSVAERCVQQTVDKPMLCKCVVFEEQLEEVAAALCARGRTPGD